MIELTRMGQVAKRASYKLATLSTALKNEALCAIASELEIESGTILKENQRDVEGARASGTSEALVDRLLLTEERVSNLARDTRRVIDLPDPVGAEIESRMLPNGIRLCRRRIPVGVLGVIYEARPNVTVDVATLALKTGNAAILRGGSETLRSNLTLVSVIQKALTRAGLPSAAVQYIDDPDRALVTQMLRLDQYIDMIIPRGGNALHRLCREQSTIPVITGGIGICHAFVDATADLEKAVNVVENSKVDRPSVCNALDTLLVHTAVAHEFLPKVAKRLAAHGVELRAAGEALDILRRSTSVSRVMEAGPEDFDQEWLGMVLGVRLVAGIDEAIDFIRAHTTDHTETIITNDYQNADRFVSELSSSALFVNASTRFNDGGQFGLGAEVAVSTQRLHARGPMGLQELTTYKWVGYGSGQIRQ